MGRILKVGLAVWNGTKMKGFRLHFTFLFFLKVRLDCNSRVEICHTSMEISLNHMDFTDFFYMLIVAKLRFIFFSECFFTNFKKYHKQSRFFGPNHIGPKTLISWILQISKFKSTIESVWGSTRFIHFHVLCKYLYLFLRQPASFYKNNSRFFADQGNVGRRTNKFT